ncbi:hypothetical protein MNV49_006016 [Pseudohyphozyma bogoriensis]|nr:hypothetical protein MNV49_006016 [Pseudohyphozyma bogoriensis]
MSTSPDPPRFTIIVRSIPFVLTRSQITSDAPNVFTERWGTHLSSSSPPPIYSTRRPELFKLVALYLAGEEILPPPPDLQDAYSAEEIKDEARAYKLSRLEKIAEEWVKRSAPTIPAYPLEEGTYVWFQGAHKWEDAVWHGDVEGRGVDEVVKRKESPVPLFVFSDVQLRMTRKRMTKASKHSTHSSRTFLAVLTTLIFPRLSLTPRTASLSLSWSSHSASIARIEFPDLDLVLTISDFMKWFTATTPAMAHQVAPMLERWLGRNVKERQFENESTLEMSVPAASGFFWGGDVHLIHIKVDVGGLCWDPSPPAIPQQQEMGRPEEMVDARLYE